MTEEFLRTAIWLAREKMREGAGGPFGAVIVKDGEIIARGWNQVTSINDPTAHAEIVAIRAACHRLGSFRLEGCDLYSSCEPCPMCLAALYWARIGRLFYAASRLDAREAGFDDDLLYREICLPPDQRVLPASQALREEALLALDEWKAESDKIGY